MKTNRLPIWIFPALMLVMVALVAIMPKSQDTRRGAYFAGTDLMLFPTDIGVTAGNEFPVVLKVQTKSITGSDLLAKVDAVRTSLCYEFDKVQIEGDTLSVGMTAVDLNESPKLSVGSSFTTIMMAKVTYKDGIVSSNIKCMDLLVKSERTQDRLGSGLVTVATIYFKGITGSGPITLVKEQSSVSGFNSVDQVSSDRLMEIGTATGMSYIVTVPTVGTRWAHDDGQAACNTTTGVWSCRGAVATDETTFSTLGGCEMSAGCDVATLKWGHAAGTCNETTGEWSCTPSESGTFDSETLCKNDVNCPATQVAAPVLNYRVAFAGVRPTTETACANWSLSIVVKKGDLTRTYTSTPVADGAVGDGVGGQLKAFKGSVALADFSDISGLAVFIKGPKHLQTKYGKVGQTSFYNQAGGEVTVTRDVATSPLYDWTGYPIIACDIVGDSATTAPNGVCNMIDYSVVKTAALANRTVGAGEALLEDLDGNCKTNVVDLNWLMQAMKERLSQLY